MLNLIVLICANVIMIFIMKKSDESNTDSRQTLFINYITAFILSCISFLLKYRMEINYSLFLLAIVNGILMAICMILQKKSIVDNGAGISTIYNRLGIIIPTVFSIVFLNEAPKYTNLLGIALSIIAIILSYNKTNEQSLIKYKYLFSILIFGGLIDFNYKIATSFWDVKYIGQYIFFSFGIAFVVMGASLCKEKFKLGNKEIKYGMGIGLANYCITWGVIHATLVLPSYIVFPVYSGCVIFFVNLIEWIFFNAKHTIKDSITMIIIFLSVLLINV